MKGLVKGLGVSLKTLVSKKATYRYPDEPLQMPDRFRGIQHFDAEKCIVCNQCVRICPTDCISLTGKRNPDPEAKQKLVIETYDINFELCILCDLCTEVCPTEAVVMTNNFELATFSRDELFKDMAWLGNNNMNVRKENHPQKPAAAARAARAKGGE